MTYTDAIIHIPSMSALIGWLEKNNTATVDPTVNDAGSSGYAVGSRWFNSATKNTFICTDATNGAAVW
ncbi:MAG: hypothetical protein KGL25_03155, partial [Gammaproteobacteria bacterium]|nr:hypothetical protein [Gammaproteobacteria bacterium]